MVVRQCKLRVLPYRENRLATPLVNSGSAKNVEIMIKILGISGTVIEDGNCDTMVREALASAAANGDDVETQFISMAGKEVAMCTHCQFCIENRVRCKIKDDAHAIIAAMEEADGIIMGGPAWCLTVAPPLVNLASRARYIHFFTQAMRDKVGAGLTVGWLGVGVEDALQAIDSVLLTWRMIRVGKAYALSSKKISGGRLAHAENGVLDDEWGMNRVRMLGQRVSEVTRMIKTAKDQGVTLSPLSKKDKVFVDGVWVNKETD
jgi:multimeric flavodoxin WrbA